MLPQAEIALARSERTEINYAEIVESMSEIALARLVTAEIHCSQA